MNLVNSYNKLDDAQLSFEFLESLNDVSQCQFSYRKIQQRAIAFLQKEFRVNAVACDVSIGVKKYKSAVAGIRKNSRSSKLSAKSFESVILEIYTDREKCFNYCANANKINQSIEKLMLKKEALEAIIRKNEPELQVKDDLFLDMATYHYEQSQNREYQKLMHELLNLKNTLNVGGRLENISLQQVANNLFLVVPEKLILVEECAHNWGLVYFDCDLNFRVVREPVWQEVELNSQQNLIFNIANAAKRSVLFTHGVKVDSSNSIQFLAPPRQRRKKN